MISGIQVIGLLFSLGMIYLSYVYYRRRDFELSDFALWLLISFFVLIAVLFPGIFESVLQPLAFYRLFDLLTLGGFIILFAVIFRMYKVTRKNERNLDEIVRNLALRGSKSKKK